MVALRALVAALVALHVVLVTDALSGSGLLIPALAAAAALAVSTALSLGALAARRAGTQRLLTAAVALIDALALVSIARITIDVDPAASIAWAFVLWVPFSIAVRSRALEALVGTTLVSALVLAAIAAHPGPLAPVAMTWTTAAVPALLVLVAGLATIVATVGHRRSGRLVERALVDERDRTARLREADELKNTFLAAVSHELRSPLTSILGFSLTLLDRAEIDDAQRERMLRTIVLEAEHLEDILANLLDLDRLTRGKATLVPVEVDASRLIADAVERVQRRSRRDIRLELEPGLRVQVDAAKVERIVENLVGNAVKYTPEGAEIAVHMRAERDGITIRVDDSGPGISRELRDTIFEPFRRGSDVGVPGTGIGLSLVDRFSRMHGGRAWVEERPGGGCRFQVYLPSAGAPARSGGARAADEDASPQQQQPGEPVAVSDAPTRG